MRLQTDAHMRRPEPKEMPRQKHRQATWLRETQYMRCERMGERHTATGPRGAGVGHARMMMMMMMLLLLLLLVRQRRAERAGGRWTMERA